MSAYRYMIVPLLLLGAMASGLALTNAELRSVSVFAQAEDFTLPEGWFVRRGHGIDMYVPQVSGGYTVHTSPEGTATLDVTIPRDGTYVMWVWFTKWAFDRNLELRVEQGGKIAGASTFARPDDHFANWSYNAQKGEKTVELKAGPAQLILYGPNFPNTGVGVAVDCVLLTQDQTYEKPDWKDFGPQYFARFTMLTPEAPAVTAGVSANWHHDPWFAAAPDIAGIDGKPAPPNTPSAWGEISSAMDTADNIETLHFNFHGAAPLPTNWRARIDFATRPDAGAIIHSVEEEWDGSTASYVTPGDLARYLKQSPMLSTMEATRRHLAAVSELKLPGGEGDFRAKIFNLEGDAYSRSPALNNLEAQTLAKMGINAVKLYGKSYQDAAAAAGMDFSKAGTQLFIHDIGLNACSFDPALKAKLEKYLTDQIKAMKKNDPAQFENVRYVVLADEPGTPNGLGHIGKCQYCRAAFLDWLKARDLSPEKLGIADWENTTDFTAKASDPIEKRRLGWYAAQFAQEISPLPFKYATDCLQKAFGRPIGTRVNFSDECMNGFGNTMSNGNGLNWFEFGRLGATTIPWTEDFLFQNPHLTPFLVDVLHSTEATKNIPLGAYIIWGYGPPTDPHSAELRAMSAAGRGAKSLNYYWYGPHYASTECAFSEDTRYVQSVAYVNRVLGLSDAVLGPAMPPARQTAILWSQATEQWPSDNICTIERRMLHYALSMQQIPVDFLCEKDLATRLKDYKVLYLPATNLPAEAAPVLRAWVEAGGTLAVCGGGPARDEFNEPSDALRAIQGLTGVTERRDAPYYRAEGALAAGAEALFAGPPAPLSVGGLHSALLPAPGVKVSATYRDGEAAVVERSLGKGRVITYGYMPGMSLLTQISAEAINSRLFWKPVAGEYYRMIAEPVLKSGLKTPVTTRLGVDAARLDGPAGFAVTLANYTGEPIDELTVLVRGVAEVKEVVSAVQGPIEFTRTEDGITVTLPLGTVDVVELTD